MTGSPGILTEVAQRVLNTAGAKVTELGVPVLVVENDPENLHVKRAKDCRAPPSPSRRSEVHGDHRLG